MTIDPPYLFGIQDEIISINFPTGNFLVIDGLVTTDVNNKGLLEVVQWSSSLTLPDAVTLIKDPSAEPLFPYMNYSVPPGDPNPGLKLTNNIIKGNISWAYPRPSVVNQHTVRGMGFFNLDLLAHAAEFNMTLIIDTLLNQPFAVRASLWGSVSDFTSKVQNGNLTSFAGAIDFNQLGGIFTEANEITCTATKDSVSLTFL